MQSDLFLFFHHDTLDVKACHLNVAIAANGDRLLEMTREHTLAIVCYSNLTFLTWCDRLLGIGWNSAAATGDGLIDNQWLIAYVCESEQETSR